MCYNKPSQQGNKMTTSKFHRTMNEAFPFGPSYGCAIEKPSKTEKALDYAVAISFGILLAFGMVAYFS